MMEVECSEEVLFGMLQWLVSLEIANAWLPASLDGESLVLEASAINLGSCHRQGMEEMMGGGCLWCRKIG